MRFAWLGVLFFVASAVAVEPDSLAVQQSKATCFRALAKFVKASKLDVDDFEIYADAPKEQTLELASVRKGNYGGKILTFRRIGDKWISDIDSIGVDPQGDPRWFIQWFGPEAAAKLGFKQLNDRTLELPDPQELIGAFQALNARLKKASKPQLPLGFYGQASPLLIEYIRRFGEDLELPIANPRYEAKADGTVVMDDPKGFVHYLHDMSFHVASVLLPEAQMRYFSSTIKFCHSALAHLETHGWDKYIKASPEELTALGKEFIELEAKRTTDPSLLATLREQDPEKYARLILARAARFELRNNIAAEIDNATAEIASALSESQRDLKKQASPLAAWPYLRPASNALYLHGKSPQEFLLERSKEAGRSNAESQLLWHRWKDERQINTYLDWDKIEADLREFSSHYPKKGGFDVAKPFPNLVAATQKICEQILNRAKDVIAVAKRLRP